jgi:hypothetical protein
MISLNNQFENNLSAKAYISDSFNNDQLIETNHEVILLLIAFKIM